MVKKEKSRICIEFFGYGDKDTRNRKSKARNDYLKAVANVIITANGLHEDMVNLVGIYNELEYVIDEEDQVMRINIKTVANSIEDILGYAAQLGNCELLKIK